MKTSGCHVTVSPSSPTQLTFSGSGLGGGGCSLGWNVKQTDMGWSGKGGLCLGPAASGDPDLEQGDNKASGCLCRCPLPVVLCPVGSTWPKADLLPLWWRGRPHEPRFWPLERPTTGGLLISPTPTILKPTHPLGRSSLLFSLPLHPTASSLSGLVPRFLCSLCPRGSWP